ncbi:MAG: DUF2267 domain-containing protein [Nitrospirae bacterium]|nr:DUF2267 domain-containing protein [Candidatus Manganitrophaceae bacterium]
MSITGLDVFDRTVQKTNHWLHRLGALLGWEDRHQSYLALRATLQALRDRLTVEEGAQLSAQLPMLIRGFYYEGWDPAHTPQKVRNRAEFLARIDQQFKADDAVDPEQVVRAVFTLLENCITAGEIKDVKSVLPAEIRDLWPDAPRARAA